MVRGQPPQQHKTRLGEAGIVLLGRDGKPSFVRPVDAKRLYGI